MLEYPDIRRMQLYGTLDRETRPFAGECEMCGAELYNEDEANYADEYIETEHGLICWDCWDDYGRWLLREQGRDN